MIWREWPSMNSNKEPLDPFCVIGINFERFQITSPSIDASTLGCIRVSIFSRFVVMKIHPTVVFFQGENCRYISFSRQYESLFHLVIRSLFYRTELDTNEEHVVGVFEV